MLVKEVMSKSLETIAPDISIQECARKMNELGVGLLPVWENGRAIGVVTDRDVCCRGVATGKDPSTTAVRAVMTRVLTSCFEDQDCTEAAGLMMDKGVRRLTVVDRKQAMVGLVSVDDLARCSHNLAGEVLEAVAPWSH